MNVANFNQRRPSSATGSSSPLSPCANAHRRIGGPQGLGGPQGETGEPFDWGKVVESENLEAGVFGIGVSFDNPNGSGRGGVLIGTGFNAEYSNALWTNAHVVQELEEALALDILSDRNPEAVAFRSGSMFRGQDAYVIPDPGLIHPAYDSKKAVGDTPEVPPVAVPLPMLDPEPSVVPGVGAS